MYILPAMKKKKKKEKKIILKTQTFSLLHPL